MIITPEKLKEWLDNDKNFTLLDTRPKDQIKQSPIKELKCVTGPSNSIDQIKGDKVLICQFGIVTEGMILENDLQNSYSLLGGVQAWNEFIKGKNDLSRWSRQTILEEIGIDGQKKIIKARVAIVGMGGLGCPAAISLVAAGVGTLNIIDGDTVDLSNLHRQHLYKPVDIGKDKVNVAKRALENISGQTKIIAFDNFLNQSNAKSCFENIDIIIDATDNIASRQIIDKVSKDENIPMVYGSLYRFEGQVGVFNVGNKIGYSELFPDGISGGKTCEEAGVVGMLPSIIGNMQALEAIKLIVNLEPNLIGKLLIYDSLQHKTEVIAL